MIPAQKTDAMEKQVDEKRVVALLERIQWARPIENRSRTFTEHTCPCCHGFAPQTPNVKTGHKPDCELYKLLVELK